jgi:hypothetical protein
MSELSSIHPVRNAVVGGLGNTSCTLAVWRCHSYSEASSKIDSGSRRRRRQHRSSSSTVRAHVQCSADRRTCQCRLPSWSDLIWSDPARLWARVAGSCCDAAARHLSPCARDGIIRINYIRTETTDSVWQIDEWARMLLRSCLHKSSVLCSISCCALSVWVAIWT